MGRFPRAAATPFRTRNRPGPGPDPGPQGGLRRLRRAAALDSRPPGRLEHHRTAQRRAPGRRTLVRGHLQRGPAAGERPPAGGGHARFHRPGGHPRRHPREDPQRLHDRPRARSRADAAPGRPHLLPRAGAQYVTRSPAPAQPSLRPAVVDRGDRALHRRTRRLRAQLRLGRPRRRPDPGRPLPLARQRGGGAPQHRPRRGGVLPRQLSGPHPVDGAGGDAARRFLPARRLASVPNRVSAAPAAPAYSTALCSIGIRFSPIRSATAE